MKSARRRAVRTTFSLAMNSVNMYNMNKFKGCTIFLSLLGKNPGVIRKASRNYEEILGW